MTPTILCQYPMTSNPRGVVRLAYERDADLYTCCIVEAGEPLPHSQMELEESAAAEHYEYAAEAGTVYEKFPGRIRA